MRRVSQRGRFRGSAGFALVEVLVSLTLFALILAMLPGALRAGNRALRDALLVSNSAGSALTLRYVAQRLEEALPHYDRQGGVASAVMFRGLNDRVRFLAPMENGPLGGGIYRLDLMVRPAGTVGRRDLVLGMTLHGDPAGRSVDAGEERVLMRAVRNVGLRYFGSRGPDDARGWHDQWVDAGRLPELVELSWQAAAPAHGGRGTLTMRVPLRLR